MRHEHQEHRTQTASHEHRPEVSGEAASGDSGVGATYVGREGMLLIGVYFAVLLLALLHMLVAFWPPSTDGMPATSAATDPLSKVTVHLFGVTASVGREGCLFVIVLASGALGGILHALRSLGWYIGNRDLRWSWIPRYALLPLTGATLALVFYLVLRAGFVSTLAAGTASPFSFAALGSLVGLFSEQAILKLKAVAETLLTKGEPGKDSLGKRPGEHRPEVPPQVAQQRANT